MERYDFVKNNNRVSWIDFARGLAVILMIYGHSVIGSLQCSFIFTFHMPIFFVLSGYLYRESSDYRVFAKKNIKKLITPYVITSFLLMIGRVVRATYQPNFYNYVGRKKVVEMTVRSSFVGFGCGPDESFVHFPFFESWTVGPLWFLIAFCWAILIFGLVMKITSKWTEIERGLLILAVSLMGYAISHFIFWIPTNLDVGMLAVIFLYFGYLIKKYMTEKMHVLTIVFLLGIYVITSLEYNSIALNIRSVPSAMTIFGAFSGSILVTEVSEMLVLKLPGKLVNIFTWLGKNSMTILCVHVLEIELIPYDIISDRLNMVSHYSLVMNIVNFPIAIIITVIFNFVRDKIKKR